MKLTVDDLVSQAYETAGSERLALLTRAAELAEVEGNLDVAFGLHEDVVYQGYYVPGSQSLLASYTWMMAKSDDDPERFRIELWSYKWVLDALPSFPSVSRSQIDAAINDLEERFLAAGDSTLPAKKLRMSTAVDLGDMDHVADALDVWLAQRAEQRRSALNDCPACDESEHVRVLIELGRHEEALDIGADLRSGRSSCSSQPHFTLGRLVGSARALDDSDAATEIFDAGLKMVDDQERFVSAIPAYVRHLVTKGDVVGAVELLDRNLHHWQAPHDDLDRLLLAQAVRLVSEAAQIGDVSLDFNPRVRAAFDGKPTAVICAEMSRLTDELAGQFDARGGNTYRRSAIDADDQILDDLRRTIANTSS